MHADGNSRSLRCYCCPRPKRTRGEGGGGALDVGEERHGKLRLGRAGNLVALCLCVSMNHCMTSKVRNFNINLSLR